MSDEKTGEKTGEKAGEMDGQDAPVRFDTKIAVLLRDDLETWQRLNVTAFLVSGLGTACPEVVGEPYEDADGTPTCRCSASPYWSSRAGRRR